MKEGKRLMKEEVRIHLEKNSRIMSRQLMIISKEVISIKAGVFVKKML